MTTAWWRTCRREGGPAHTHIERASFWTTVLLHLCYVQHWLNPENAGTHTVVYTAAISEFAMAVTSLDPLPCIMEWVPPS